MNKEKCIACDGPLTKSSPLYDQGICLYCVRQDTRTADYRIKKQYRDTGILQDKEERKGNEV